MSFVSVCSVDRLVQDVYTWFSGWRCGEAFLQSRRVCEPCSFTVRMGLVLRSNTERNVKTEDVTCRCGGVALELFKRTFGGAAVKDESNVMSNAATFEMYLLLLLSN